MPVKKLLMIRILVFLVCFFIMQPLICQDKPILLDSGTFDPDNAELIETKSNHSPSKASFYSAVLPGLGQAYNKKYWKIPLVYGAFAATGLTANFWNVELQNWRTELFKIQNGGTSRFTLNFVETNIDRSRQKRDKFYIYTAIVYFLNVFEAHVDAHLREFEVNDDLSFKLSPYFEEENIIFATSAGLSLKIYFR